MEDWIEKYIKMVESLDSYIPNEQSECHRRQSFLNIPYATIHSKLVVHVEEDFIVYEHYGTWFLTILGEK